MDEDDLPYFEESSQQSGRLKNFGNIPLLVITQDSGATNCGIQAADVAQNTAWEREQEASKALSPLSWRVIARGSGHIVPIDRPDLIVAELTNLVEYLRGGSSPPFGSTSAK